MSQARLSPRYARAAQALAAMSQAVQKAARERDASPLMLSLEAAAKDVERHGELRRQVAVDLAFNLLPVEGYDRFTFSLLKMLRDDPDLTELEGAKIRRGLLDAGRRLDRPVRPLQRFWAKRSRVARNP